MINKQIMQGHFSRNAVTYDQYASVQQQMAGELMARVAQSSTAPERPAHILDVGCGTGEMLEHLTRRYPDAGITAVDIAPGMLARARTKYPQSAVCFICGDVEELEIRQTFDLIVANAAWQWFNQPGLTLAKLFRQLKPQGMLAFTTFGRATFQELQQSFKLAQTQLGIMTENLPGQPLPGSAELSAVCREHLGAEASAGLTIDEALEYVYYDSVRDFLTAVKKAGANNSNCRRGSNPALTRAMLETYQKNFSVNQKIVATYHCLYVMLQKRGGRL